MIITSCTQFDSLDFSYHGQPYLKIFYYFPDSFPKSMFFSLNIPEPNSSGLVCLESIPLIDLNL